MNTPWPLIDAYLDDGLSSADADELRRWLAADRQHLREFVLAVHQHRSMRAMARLAGKSAVPARAVEAEIFNQENEDLVLADLTVANLSWIERCRLRLMGFMVVRRVALALTAVMIFAVATWMAWRSAAWTPPVIGLIEGAGVGQVTVEDNRILQQLSRRWTASRFALLRRCGVWLHAPSRELRLRPGDIIKFSPAFGIHLPGDAAQPGQPASLTLTYTNDATVIRLKENATLKLLTSGKGKRYELISGVMEIEAAPQPENKPLQVFTRMASVRVVGTKLSLAASGRSTRVQVTEGKVSLEPRATRQSTTVTAGERAIAATNASVRMQTLRPITNHYGSGSILREHWSSVPGRFVQDLTANAAFQAAPNRLERVSSLESPDAGTRGEDAYGARYRGYLHAPVTGEYTFWAAADDTGEVWLSTDERPENKRLICQAREWSLYFRNWWQYPEQESPAIHLEAGKRYYLEALHKEGGGGDFFSVAWQPPGAELEVISGADLSPFEPVKLARR